MQVDDALGVVEGVQPDGVRRQDEAGNAHALDVDDGIAEDRRRDVALLGGIQLGQRDFERPKYRLMVAVDDVHPRAVLDVLDLDVVRASGHLRRSLRSPRSLRSVQSRVVQDAIAPCRDALLFRRIVCVERALVELVGRLEGDGGLDKAPEDAVALVLPQQLVAEKQRGVLSLLGQLAHRIVLPVDPVVQIAHPEDGLDVAQVEREPGNEGRHGAVSGSTIGIAPIDITTIVGLRGVTGDELELDVAAIVLGVVVVGKVQSPQDRMVVGVPHVDRVLMRREMGAHKHHSVPVEGQVNRDGALVPSDAQDATRHGRRPYLSEALAQIRPGEDNDEHATELSERHVLPRPTKGGGHRVCPELRVGVALLLRLCRQGLLGSGQRDGGTTHLDLLQRYDYHGLILRVLGDPPEERRPRVGPRLADVPRDCQHAQRLSRVTVRPLRLEEILARRIGGSVLVDVEPADGAVGGQRIGPDARLHDAPHGGRVRPEGPLHGPILDRDSVNVSSEGPDPDLSPHERHAPDIGVVHPLGRAKADVLHQLARALEDADHAVRPTDPNRIVVWRHSGDNPMFDFPRRRPGGRPPRRLVCVSNCATPSRRFVAQQRVARAHAGAIVRGSL